jgi:hypothetical protein
MIRIEKTLPGELEGDVDPAAYGFEVIRQEPPDEEEATARVGQLYAQLKERTGMVIPRLEPYLAALPEHHREPGHPNGNNGTNGSAS